MKESDKYIKGCTYSHKMYTQYTDMDTVHDVVMFMLAVAQHHEMNWI